MSNNSDFLVDSLNLSRFERSDSFRYHGGHFKQSPAELRVPSAGNWSLVIIPGNGGAVRASVEVVPV